MSSFTFCRSFLLLFTIQNPSLLKDKSSVGMIDNKIQDNTARKGVSYFLPLYFAAYVGPRPYSLYEDIKGLPP